jgi:NAD(P)H-dependent FMN reductase
MPKLAVVIVSTRPGRVGLPVAHWFIEQAKAFGKFEVEVIDLKEVNLPLLDEPKHPRLQQHVHDHTKAWSARIKAVDAFVFVTPEYNFSAPASLLNAVSFLSSEWNYKAAGFVSYGGASGGLRAVQMSKQLFTALRVMPIPETVSIPFVTKLLKPDGSFDGGESQAPAVKSLLDELFKWTVALTPLRS